MKIVLIALLFALATAELAPLLHTDNANVIPGSFIIILKDGLNITHLDDHVKELHVKFASGSVSKENQIVHLYSIGSLTGFSAWLSNDMVQEQLAHPNVKYIEADQTMSINYIQERAPLATNTQSSATWGIDRIDQPALPLSGTYTYNSVAGSGVDVYVIDTGILTTHNDFGGRASAVFNAISGESGQDLNGHGTHCAGTIGGATYGVAKKVTLKAVKVLSASGSGSNAGVIAGVDYVTNDKTTTHPKVGSMSLGGGASTTLDSAVQKSIAAGVTYAIAAGNDNANACNSSPARVATAITVGATTSTDARSSFSNFGSCVSLFAPGSSITSDWIGTSNSATNTISGTSMATPHVAGAIALAIAQGTATTPAAIKTLFTNGANSNANRVTSPGASSPNYLLYTNPK